MVHLPLCAFRHHFMEFSLSKTERLGWGVGEGQLELTGEGAVDKSCRLSSVLGEFFKDYVTDCIKWYYKAERDEQNGQLAFPKWRLMTLIKKSSKSGAWNKA